MKVWILKKEYRAPYPTRELKEFRTMGELEQFFYGGLHSFILYPEIQTYTGAFLIVHYQEPPVNAFLIKFRITCEKVGVEMTIECPWKEWAWAIFHDAYPMISPDDVEIY